MHHSNGPNASRPFLASAAPVLSSRDIPQESHALKLYISDESLIASIAAFVGSGLGAGDHALVLASKAHCDAIDMRLLTHGLSVAALKARNQLTLIDSAEVLPRFLQNGSMDEKAARNCFESLLTRVAPAGKNLYVFSELAPTLLAAGHEQAAMTLEAIASELVAKYRFRLVCGYALRSVGRFLEPTKFAMLCKEHDCFIPAESYKEHQSEKDRLREVCSLQQQSAALGEEHLHRQLAEAALKEERATLQTALTIADLGTWEFQMGVARLTCSPRCKSILALRQIDGGDVRSLLQHVHPEHHAGALLRLERAVADAMGYQDEFRVVHASGQQRWVRMICRYSQLNSGTVLGFVRDSTDEREVSSNDPQKRCSNNN